MTDRLPTKGSDMDEQATQIDDDLWGRPAVTPAPAAAEDGPAPAGSSKARKWVAAVAGAAVVGVAAIVGANIASSSTQNLGAAGPGGAGGPGAFGGRGGFGGPGGGNGGTIASIDGATIKMTTFDRATVNVTTSASTVVTISATGTLADVKVGDNLRVAGTTSGTSVAAVSVTDSGTSPLADLPAGGQRGAPPAGGAAPNGAGVAPNGAGAANPPQDGNRPPGGPGGGDVTSGVVKSVSGSTFIVAIADGSTVTVSTTTATIVTVVRPATVSALKVGDQIQVTGATGTDGAIAASSIRSGVLGGGGRGQGNRP